MYLTVIGIKRRLEAKQMEGVPLLSHMHICVVIGDFH
jgi:hypothetical protein